MFFKISSFKERQQLKVSKDLEGKVKERTIMIAAQRDEKEILLKEGHLYSIHYRLIPYMRVKAGCDYATAIHEVRIK